MNKILLSIIIILGLVLRLYRVEFPLTALLGCLCIPVIYIVIGKLFSIKAGLFCAFVIAVSPWHIILSRGSFEGVSPLSYFDFFSGRFLFFEAFRYMGAMYLFELFFLILGIYFVVTKVNFKIKSVLLGWLLISPLLKIPLLIVFPLIIITGLGIDYLFEIASSRKLLALVLGLYILGIVYFVDQYFIHFLHFI